MTTSEWVSVALKVATPWALVVAVPPPEMAEEPAPWPKVTTWPETGVPDESVKVTVMLDVEVPSSGTEVGAATTLEELAETGPWKATLAVWSMTRLDWEVSVAV